MFSLLSHHLSSSTPGFAGGGSLEIEPLKEIASGGSSNNYKISLPCHLGTHIDAPRHVSDKGRPIAAYPVSAFIFTRPKMIHLVLGSGELVRRRHLEGFEESISVCDILFIRSGFQRFRETDKERYSSQNPGFSLEGAKYLASFRKLRALGFDFISLSSVPHRREGRMAHRALLSGRDFFIIEDMDLSHYPQDVGRIIVAPLFVEGVDSVPCTVLAEHS
jgi:arylformamidase